MTFPNNCIRGISTQSFILDDGTVGSSLFSFQDTSRDDGCKDISINWEDNEQVGEFTLNQTKENKEDELQFKAGYVVIPRQEIDHLNNQPTVNSVIGYERQPLDNNPYHGNILVRGDIPKPTIRKIQAGLALIVSRIVFRE